MTRSGRMIPFFLLQTEALCIQSKLPLVQSQVSQQLCDAALGDRNMLAWLIPFNQYVAHGSFKALCIFISVLLMMPVQRQANINIVIIIPIIADYDGGELRMSNSMVVGSQLVHSCSQSPGSQFTA